MDLPPADAARAATSRSTSASATATSRSSPSRSIGGFGMNLEIAGGVTHDLELGLRTGVRFDDDGQATQADRYGRPFDTETYGTGFDRMANPELRLRWTVARGSNVLLGLETRAYLPIEAGLALRRHVRPARGLPPRQRAHRHGRLRPHHLHRARARPARQHPRAPVDPGVADVLARSALGRAHQEPERPRRLPLRLRPRLGAEPPDRPARVVPVPRHRIGRGARARSARASRCRSASNDVSLFCGPRCPEGPWAHHASRHLSRFWSRPCP